MTFEERYKTNANGLNYTIHDDGEISFYNVHTDTFKNYPKGTDPDTIEITDI